MTNAQEKAITLALNVLHVGFFECPKHLYEYFIDNDDSALLMAAGDVNAVGTSPPLLALAVLQKAVARTGLFTDMTDFAPPAHYCSFLKDQIDRSKRTITLRQCEEAQEGCPYATFENIKRSSGTSSQHQRCAVARR
jgi:hypothetical protein